MKFSASAATLAIAMVVPSSVVAAPPVVTPEVVKPQVVKPQVVKPQVVKPQPVAPAPEPTPEPEAAPIPRSVPDSSTSAPSPSTPPSHSPIYGPGSNDSPPAEDEVPGAHIPSAPYAPPYPEALPAHWDDGCDLSCLQEWYSWYDSRWSAVVNEALATGDAQDMKSAQLLADEVDAIEAAAKAMGGVLEIDQPPAEQMPAAGAPWPGIRVPSSESPSLGEAIVGLPSMVVEAIDDVLEGIGLPVAGARPEPSAVPDAITSAGAITPRGGGVATPPDAGTPQEVDLGSWDLSGVVDAAEAMSGVAIATAIAKGLAAISGVCSGPKIQDKPEFCPQ